MFPSLSAHFPLPPFCILSPSKSSSFRLCCNLLLLVGCFRHLPLRICIFSIFVSLCPCICICICICIGVSVRSSLWQPLSSLSGWDIVGASPGLASFWPCLVCSSFLSFLAFFFFFFQGHLWFPPYLLTARPSFRPQHSPHPTWVDPRTLLPGIRFSKLSRIWQLTVGRLLSWKVMSINIMIFGPLSPDASGLRPQASLFLRP